MHRGSFYRGIALAVGILFAGLHGGGAVAHHGWAWATDEQFEITGTITEVQLGNPHGELTLEADGEEWTAEIGQPWRNDRAGLTESLLAVGTEITVSGHRAADPERKVVKAEKVIIAGETYRLYPDRES